MKDYLERGDRKIFRKGMNSTGHLLLPLTRVKRSSYQSTKEISYKPKINTMRFKYSSIGRLVFKYGLACTISWILVTLLLDA